MSAKKKQQQQNLQWNGVQSLLIGQCIATMTIRDVATDTQMLVDTNFKTILIL